MPSTDPYQIPIEGLGDRPAEWADIELGYGQEPPLRTYRHDRLHDEVEVTGPIIEYHPPDRPA